MFIGLRTWLWKLLLSPEGSALGTIAPPRQMLAEGGTDRIDSYFEACVDERVLAIFEARAPYVDENEHTWWNTYIQLVTLDQPGGEVQWRFPNVAGLAELMDAVRYETADVDGFLDSLLDQAGSNSSAHTGNN